MSLKSIKTTQSWLGRELGVDLKELGKRGDYDQNALNETHKELIQMLIKIIVRELSKKFL